MIHTRDLYSSFVDCCGCEACIQACPKGIIKVNFAFDGFIYPKAVNPSACVNCKKCLEVCPLKNPYIGNKAICHYGGHFVLDKEIKKSASGGLATSIARGFVRKGGLVYGVSYSDDFNKAEYIRCATTEELEMLRGSKYSQAFKHQIYHKIKKDLMIKQEVLFIGLPCEVQALKLFLGRNYENLYTVSLICHGPTSPLVLSEYIQNLCNQYKSSLKSFTLRAKPKGWKPYFIKAEFNNGEIFDEEFHKSTFGVAFRELKRPSCAKCKFKLDYDHSHINADLIIGDFHGATQNMPQYNKWGVSQSSVLTNKGEVLMKLTIPEFQYSEISPRKAIYYNKAIGKVIRPRWNRNQFAKALSTSGLIYASKLLSVKVIDIIDKNKNKILRGLVKCKKMLIG